MKKQILYRNIQAREHLEIFLVSAALSVLVIRFFLAVADYPQLGGGGLHIAHMLWGGLFMLVGIVMLFAFIGERVQKLAAFISGIGFGTFIDEIGKFITSDNNYFFQPSIGIIYAIFIILYLSFNFLARDRHLTSREYQLNALKHLEEAIVHDMDPVEKERAHDLLAKADHRNPITGRLQSLVNDVELVPEQSPGPISRFFGKLDRVYTRFWRRRSSDSLVKTFFILETLLFLVIFSYGIFNNLDDMNSLLTGQASYELYVYAGQIISSLVAAGFAVVGAVLLTRSRLLAFEQFRRATLINLFLTDFFIFSRVEFEALPGFLFNLGVLLFINYSIRQELRHGATAPKA